MSCQKLPKVYRITKTKTGTFGTEYRTYTQEGTLPELIQAYSYTLECGQSWEHEKGNKKINRNPKSVASLCTNLYNAMNNSAQNGYGGCSFEWVELKGFEAEKVLVSKMTTAEFRTFVEAKWLAIKEADLHEDFDDFYAEKCEIYGRVNALGQKF